MRWITVFFLSLFLLAGCASPGKYSHPYKDYSDFQRDWNQCKYEASLASGGGLVLVNGNSSNTANAMITSELVSAFREDDLRRKCMESKGYVKTR